MERTCKAETSDGQRPLSLMAACKPLAATDIKNFGDRFPSSCYSKGKLSARCF